MNMPTNISLFYFIFIMDMIQNDQVLVVGIYTAEQLAPVFLRANLTLSSHILYFQHTSTYQHSVCMPFCLTLPKHMTAHCTLLDFTILTILGDLYNPQSSSHVKEDWKGVIHTGIHTFFANSVF
jgi:hypothetical protein